MSDSKNSALAKMNEFLDIVESRIREVHAAKKAIAATKIAKDEAEKFGWEWSQAYHVINVYLDERPDLGTKKGPNGGIVPIEWMSGKKAEEVDSKAEAS